MDEIGGNATIGCAAVSRSVAMDEIGGNRPRSSIAPRATPASENVAPLDLLPDSSGVVPSIRIYPEACFPATPP
jgi:hypothetical protein